MKYVMMAILIIAAGCSVVIGAEQMDQNDKTDADQNSVEIQIPPKNTSEYWNVRSEGISQLIPLLTKKRAETKKKQQLMYEYLISIGRGSEFAAANIPVPEDPNIFFEVLQIGQGLKDMNMPIPKKRPSWEELMEVAMKFVLWDGYLPTQIEQEELPQYVEVCKKKEQYGIKVRKELKLAVDQCARMWVYLDSINQLGSFKTDYVNRQLQQEAEKAQQRAESVKQHREEMIAKTSAKKQQKEQDALNRASFHSQLRERAYEDRQARLNSRYAYSGYRY